MASNGTTVIVCFLGIMYCRSTDKEALVNEYNLSVSNYVETEDT